MEVEDLLNLTLTGYSLGSSYCHQNLQKGGVCIFVREDQSFNKIGILLHCTEHNLEVCATELETKSSNLRTLALYRDSFANFNQFRERLDATLKYLHNPQSEFLICGDINVDHLNDNNHKKQTHY
jgi:exonuclease III